MNLRGEPLRVGDLIHRERREATPESIAFYADTFDDHHPAYAADAAPPLLFHSEVYEHVDRWYLKNLVGNLHARQEWSMFAPIRPGSTVHTRSTLIERYRRRNRDYLVNEVDYTDADERLLVRGRTHQSFLAEQVEAGDGFVVDRASAQGKPKRAVGEGDGAELAPLDTHVDEEMCMRFSGPRRNYHNDAEEARKLGFPEIVVQGMLGTCLISQVMGRNFGEGWFAGGRMDVRLVNVLWGGERVRTRAKFVSSEREGSYTRQSFEVWVEKQDETATVVTVGTASALT